MHIGQTIRAVAAAAAVAAEDSPLSKDILEAISCGSNEGGVDDWELSERVLAEGDKWELAVWGEGTAGDRFLPFPKTLPPPSVRFDIFGLASGLRSVQHSIDVMDRWYRNGGVY